MKVCRIEINDFLKFSKRVSEKEFPSLKMHMTHTVTEAVLVILKEVDESDFDNKMVYVPIKEYKSILKSALETAKRQLLCWAREDKCKVLEKELWLFFNSSYNKIVNQMLDYLKNPAFEHKSFFKEVLI